MEINELKVQIRNQTGKGHSRRLRIDGCIPAVFYGPQSESIELAVHVTDLLKLLKDKEENIFIKLLIDENKVEKLSMIKEIQFDPLTKKPLHADFYEIRMDRKITFDVPIHFAGQPVGVENGGELHHLKREIKVSCLPGNLPDFIEVDVKNLNIGDSLSVKDVKMSDDITVLDSLDAAIAIVAAVKVVKEVEVTEEAAEAEPTGEEKEPKEE